MANLFSRRLFLQSVAAGACAGVAGKTGASLGPDGKALQSIRRVAIHPTVGIARVGNSQEYFYFGPELPASTSRGPFKDPSGAMAKQAVRFRLYGYDRKGRVVCELTAADAGITWQIVVANAKAAAYNVDTAFDVPGAPSVGRRNASVTDRASLVIRATPRSLSGGAAGPFALDGGSFSGTPVNLGEALTDAKGRLVVMPGSGTAYSTPDAPPLGSFANNDGWTDDTCDGPVRATVRIGERSFEADSAWVICGSPNYAPAIPAGLVTLYDAIESALVEAGALDAGATDFQRHVWPIFERIADMQWVNAGYLASHGFGSEQEWTQPRWRRRLANPSTANEGFRQSVAATFRNPDFSEVEPSLEPQLYGDKVTMPPNAVEPRQWLALTPLQYRRLRAWADGNFTGKMRKTPTHLSALPLQQQPAALDRAALEACLGGAFHPGVEFPWIARVPWIWTSDMRLRGGALEPDLHDYGETLNAAVALSKQGPLGRAGVRGTIMASSRFHSPGRLVP
ncbi:LodA/GoxA family CTQ-dependent oxidase [Methylococcus sp. ANG]|uniref:LodA/GoxA family CTQ-dependent oxidase n=1 Tax=Methylococcus sp. ANG TaxID=3231903 RepID=UPI003458EE1A